MRNRMPGPCRGWIPVRRIMAGGCLLVVVGLSIPAHADWTLGGTAVGEDDWTGVKDVQVTVYPDSNRVLTDAQGDFLLPWSGRQGYLTLLAPDPGPRGKEYCKRVVLHAKASIRADSTFDVGAIRITPRLNILDGPKPQAPPGTLAPLVVRAAGPRPGQPDFIRFIMNIKTDIFGRTVSVATVGADTMAFELRDSLFVWLRRIPWKVPTESRCGEDEPFWAIQPLPYSWRDGAWALAPFGSGPPQPRGSEIRIPAPGTPAPGH